MFILNSIFFLIYLLYYINPILKYTVVSLKKWSQKSQFEFPLEISSLGPILKKDFRKYLYICGPAIASKPLNLFDEIHTNTVF